MGLSGEGRLVAQATVVEEDQPVIEAWLPGMVRLFASHLAEKRALVADVATALRPYGIATFVAHDAIEVTREWRDSIEQALNECDCMLVFEHPDFHASQWTDQEVGWALARDVPVAVLLFEGGQLGGFLEQYQAIPVDGTERAELLAEKVVDAFVRRTDLRTRIIDGLVEALGQARTYVEAGRTAETLLSMVDELRRSDVVSIFHHYQQNDQVSQAGVANRPLRRLVELRAPDMLTDFWPSPESEDAS